MITDPENNKKSVVDIAEKLRPSKEPRLRWYGHEIRDEGEPVVDIME